LCTSNFSQTNVVIVLGLF